MSFLFLKGTCIFFCHNKNWRGPFSVCKWRCQSIGYLRKLVHSLWHAFSRFLLAFFSPDGSHICIETKTFVCICLNFYCLHWFQYFSAFHFYPSIFAFYVTLSYPKNVQTALSTSFSLAGSFSLFGCINDAADSQPHLAHLFFSGSEFLVSRLWRMVSLQGHRDRPRTGPRVLWGMPRSGGNRSTANDYILTEVLNVCRGKDLKYIYQYLFPKSTFLLLAVNFPWGSFKGFLPHRGFSSLIGLLCF